MRDGETLRGPRRAATAQLGVDLGEVLCDLRRMRGGPGDPTVPTADAVEHVGCHLSLVRRGCVRVLLAGGDPHRWDVAKRLDCDVVQAVVLAFEGDVCSRQKL